MLTKRWVLGLWVAPSSQSVCRMLTSGLALLMFTVHQKTKSLSPQVSEKPVLNK